MPDAPPFPDQLQYVWDWFVEIDAGISGNGLAVPTISWRDLIAWRDLTGIVLESWEARLIVRLSVLKASIQSEKADGAQGQDRSG